MKEKQLTYREVYELMTGIKIPEPIPIWAVAESIRKLKFKGYYK